MASVGSIEYTVSVETQQSITAAQQFDKQMDQVQDSARKTDKELGKLDTGFSRLATAIKGVIAVSALRSMAGMVQQYQAMSERVEMATRSTEEFDLVQRRLQATADGTYRSLAEAQELYIRTADSIRDMGYSLEQTIDIQDSMSYAFVTNATSADRAQAAINQFTKAVNTGRVSADQWETVSSAIPTIINDIAAASGKSASEVRALGAAGKLTARELTEGFRQSLDDVRAAADNMATDLIDAAVRSRNALTTVLVGLENQTGAIQAVTDGIIAASEAMLEFGQDAERMESFLQLATTAAASLAAVMAGRVIMSMVAGTQALYANTVAARAKAAADLQAAQSAAAAAAQNLIQAQTAERAAVGLSTHAAASRTLAAAQAQATAATATLTAAQRTMAASFSLATAAANGLRTAMAFLGGPAGLILLVGAAFLTMGRNAKSASGDTDLLTGSIKELTTAQRDLMSIQIAREMSELEKSAAATAKQIDLHTRAIENTNYASAELEKAQREHLTSLQAEWDTTNQKIDQYRDRLQQIANTRIPRPSGSSTGTEGGDPPAATSSQTGKDAIKSLEDQLAATKLLGAARARLTALQKLGADATDEEREEVARLVTEIYNLEESQKAAAKAAEDRAAAEKRAAEEQAGGIQANADTIAALEEQMRQAEMSAGELAQRQAELSLNEYATPQQIARVKELGAALRENAEAEEREKMRQAAVAADPRTEAANQYAEQLAAYQQYKEQELLTDLQYNELKNAAATEYEQARLAAQEEMFRAQSASNEFLMGSIDALGNASTNVISGLLSGTMNTKEAMQALGNAIFQHAVGALVEMGVQHVKNIIMGQAAQTAAMATAAATGTAMAAAYTPAAIAASIASFGGAAAAGTAAMATAVPTMAGMIALSGARRQGGPVSPGSMYRVNEGGRPEVFQNNMGQQYMIPNERGKVVSNRDAQGGGSGVGVVINLIESPDSGRGGEMTSRTEDDQRIVDVIVASIRGQERVYDSISRTFGIREQGE